MSKKPSKQNTLELDASKFAVQEGPDDGNEDAEIVTEKIHNLAQNKTKNINEKKILEKSDDVTNEDSDDSKENWENDSDEFDDEYMELSEVKNLDEPNLSIIPKGSELTVYTGKVDTSDPFYIYLQQISRYPLLSAEQEKELISALKESGDVEIAKKLVMANLRLVVKIAMEYRSTWQNVMDLIQEGNIGLMKAVSKYDDSKGAKLSYYASWWIKSYILKFILDNFRLVKLGTSNDQKKLFYNLMKEKNRLISMGINPDQKLISENLGVSEKAVAVMDKRLNYGGEVSLDAPIKNNGDETSSRLGDLLSDDEASPIESDVASRQELTLLKNHLSDFLDSLKPRDREIFKNRLLDEAPMSLQEIGDLYGVSRERIRQIESRLLEKLKVYMSEFIR